MENFIYHFTIIGLLTIIYLQTTKTKKNETQKRIKKEKVLHNQPRRNKVVKEQKPELPQAELFPTHQLNTNGEANTTNGSNN